MNIKKNPFHDGKRELSGRKNVASSKDFLLGDVKVAAKAQNVTINDMLTSCLSASVKEYFESKGDMTTNEINIVIPANIRFKHYPSVDKLKLENKFAVVPLRIPLKRHMKDALKAIPVATSKIRKQFGEIYATYVLTKLSVALMPYFISNWYMNFSIMPFTFAFSNTPGILKQTTLNG